MNLRFRPACKHTTELCTHMLKNALTPSLLLCATIASAQWELVTPIKTRSEFEAIKMVTDEVGYAIDKPMGAILRTRDGGTTWERMASNLTNSPEAVFMWDEERGIAVGESGSVYLTSDGFTTISGRQKPDVRGIELCILRERHPGLGGEPHGQDQSLGGRRCDVVADEQRASPRATT